MIFIWVRLSNLHQIFMAELLTVAAQIASITSALVAIIALLINRRRASDLDNPDRDL